MNFMPIVLADDDAQVRSIIQRLLSDQGFTVIEAEDGLSALAVIQRLNGMVALLVSDISMPNLEAWISAEWLKRRSRHYLCY